mmetsp:Transcript_52503/g.154970  ORF Transcript_52503/g.154970 Transcript_52503/m.154970 type:complete len:406 (-) Transcript_52503:878-2095(-)
MRLEDCPHAVIDRAARVHAGAPQQPLVALVQIEPDTLHQHLHLVKLARGVAHAPWLYTVHLAPLRVEPLQEARHKVHVAHGDGVPLRSIHAFCPHFGRCRTAQSVRLPPQTNDDAAASNRVPQLVVKWPNEVCVVDGLRRHKAVLSAQDAHVRRCLLECRAHQLDRERAHAEHERPHPGPRHVVHVTRKASADPTLERALAEKRHVTRPAQPTVGAQHHTIGRTQHKPRITRCDAHQKPTAPIAGAAANHSLHLRPQTEAPHEPKLLESKAGTVEHLVVEAVVVRTVAADMPQAITRFRAVHARKRVSKPPPDSTSGGRLLKDDQRRRSGSEFGSDGYASEATANDRHLLVGWHLVRLHRLRAHEGVERAQCSTCRSLSLRNRLIGAPQHAGAGIRSRPRWIRGH